MTHIEIYNQIIENRLQNPLSENEYGENHHIKPKSIYPKLAKDSDNIVRLTAEEHFLCHYHLWKHYQDELKNKIYAKKMCFAFNMMKRIIQKCTNLEIMSQLYAEVRKDFSEAHKGQKHSEETRKKMSEARKGKKRSEETRKKMSENHACVLGENNPNYGKHHSEETRRKISEKLKGFKPSEQTRRKLSEALLGENNPNYGKHHSEETRKKMSEALKGQHWYNNGKINIRTDSCPEGFTAGRVK